MWASFHRGKVAHLWGPSCKHGLRRPACRRVMPCRDDELNGADAPRCKRCSVAVAEAVRVPKRQWTETLRITRIDGDIMTIEAD